MRDAAATASIASASNPARHSATWIESGIMGTHEGRPNRSRAWWLTVLR